MYYILHLLIGLAGAYPEVDPLFLSLTTQTCFMNNLMEHKPSRDRVLFTLNSNVNGRWQEISFINQLLKG